MKDRKSTQFTKLVSFVQCVRKQVFYKGAQNNPNLWSYSDKAMYDIQGSALPPLHFQENLEKRVEHSGGEAMLQTAEDVECFHEE